MEQKTSVDDKGLHSKDVYKIRIPEDAETGTKALCDTRRISEDGRCIQRLDNSKGDIFVKGLWMILSKKHRISLANIRNVLEEFFQVQIIVLADFLIGG